MSLTRRNWFLHRVAPASALFAGAGATAALPTAAAAAGRQKSLLDKSLRIHPLLQAAAQQDPERKIGVIVQKNKTGKGSAKNNEIARANEGTVTEDFDAFINGFAMTVKAKNVYKLAKHPNVAYVSPNGKIRYDAISTAALKTSFLQTLNIPSIWNGTTPATGNGVSVAILDSGINVNHPDFATGVTNVLINPRATGRKDQNGHGTHVAGIIKGRDASGRYIGVAPDARIFAVQIADDQGMSLESDLLKGLQWVANNRTANNIKVVNLSVNGATPASYLTSPICAAAEVLWSKGVVVVVAAGNRGSVANAVHFAPANDPFVITVGALDNNLTGGTSTDDSLAAFSSRGSTLDGHAKPDVVAPGRMIVAPLAGTSSTLAKQFPDRIVDSSYLRLSGTSMAAPVVAGAVALILERFPNLTPNQVKWLLQTTMKTYPGQVGAAGVIDPLAAIQRAAQGSIGSANAGYAYNAHVADTLGQQANYDSAFWDSAFWDSAFWDSAFWDSAFWDSAFWESSYEFFTGE